MDLVDRHVVVLVTGIPASGKSTVAELLARRFARGAHVRGDVFRRMVVSGREEMTAVPSPAAWELLRLRYRLGTQTADAFFEHGLSVVVQDVVVGSVLSEYVATIRSRPLVVVVLAPRPDVVARRDAERTKTGYWPGAATADQMDDVLRRDTPPIGLWLDTSTDTPDPTVEGIITRAWEDGRVD